MSDAVLVTGATGFLGRHLVERLLRRPLPVYALVRPTPAGSAKGRLRACGLDEDALTIVEGDLARSDLGGAINVPSGVRFSHVFHLAALYDLMASAEAIERANVDGTRHLIAWLNGRPFDGRFHHVSSISVAGKHAGPFGESDFDVGQRFEHAYARTKFESERLVREAGFSKLRVYRPGVLIGHSQSGAADRIDGFYYGFAAIRALRDRLPARLPLPVAPRGTLPLAPIDFAAESLDVLAHQPGLDGRTFHIFDPATPTFVRAMDVVSQVAGGPRLIEMRGIRRLTSQPLMQLLGQSAAVRSLRKGFEEDLGVPAGASQTLPIADFDAAETTKVLTDLGVTCPSATAYLPAVWSYYESHLDPRARPELRRRQYFEGRVVLVTGGSSGIGEALGCALGELGAKVVLAARREEELARVVESIEAKGGSASYVVADLSDLAQCDRTIEKVIDRHGRIDVLINNAGRSIRRVLTESLERFHDVERLMAINFFAPARLIRGALPRMREQGSGHIVNILSAGVGVPSPAFGGYTASKAALAQLCDTLASELAHEGIHVTSAFLGYVRTPMVRGMRDDWLMPPSKAATQVLDAVAGRKSHVLTPWTASGRALSLVSPKLLTRVMNIGFRIGAKDPAFELERSLLAKLLGGRRSTS